MRTPPAFEAAGKAPRDGRQPALRFWSIRHARALEAFYRAFEAALMKGAPVLARLGWLRLEKPVAGLERAVKGALFDCRMCGQCMLSSSGMSCPMNCPKGIRNGPCGGVRQNGNCEVYAEMPCVWVKAYEGAGRMREGARIEAPQPPVDHRLKGRSSWLAVARGTEAPKEHAAKPAPRKAA